MENFSGEHISIYLNGINPAIFKILGFLVFYITLSPITIYVPSIAQVLAYILLCLILINLGRYNIFDPKIRNSRSLSIFLFFLAFFIPILLHGDTPFVIDFLQWVSFFVIVSVKQEYRILILKYAINILCILILCSLLEYLIGYFIGKTFIIAHIDANDRSYTQSFFNLYRFGNLQTRFCSLSNEPGTLGALCGFLIAFLPFGKNYNRKILIFAIAGLLSLSLAFYIYLFVILVLKTATKKIPIKIFFVTLIVIFFVIYLFQNSIKNAIIDRVAEREDIESIDDRTSEQVNTFVENIFNNTNAIYGVGNRTANKLIGENEKGNAGIKWKLFQYGIFGVGFYFIGLIILLNKRRNLNVSMTFTLLFFGLYFYSVGSWGLPIFVLLMFTTMPSQGIAIENKRIHTQ